MSQDFSSWKMWCCECNDKTDLGEGYDYRLYVNAEEFGLPAHPGRETDTTIQQGSPDYPGDGYAQEFEL